MNGSPRQAEEKRVSLRERSEPGANAPTKAQAVGVSAFVRTRTQENFGGPAEASSEGWGPRGTKEF